MNRPLSKRSRSMAGGLILRRTFWTINPTGFSGNRPWSVSRLNHRQPRIQAHPEIVQGATDLHHHITNTFFPQTNAVFDDTTALDTAVDMLDPQPPLVEHLIGQVLLQGELRTAGFFVGIRIS